jgi:hypothetical protein
MAIAFIAGTQGDGASTTATTVSVSYTVAAGDLLLVAVYCSSSATTNADTPNITAGSANLTRLWSLGSKWFHTAIYYRFVQAGDPSSYSFTLSSGAPASAMALRYSGVDTTTPFRDWIGVGSIDSSGVTATSVQFPAVSNLQSNDMVVAFAGYGRNTKASTITAYTTPTSWNSRQTNTTPTSSTAFAGYGAFFDRLGVDDTPTVTGQAGNHSAVCVALIPADNLVPDATGDVISFVNASTARTVATGATSLSINAPTGIADGDLLILAAGQSGGFATYSPPAGWLPIEMAKGCYSLGTTSSTSDLAAEVWYKVASSEASSYTVSFSSTSTLQEQVLAIVAYRGLRSPWPIKLHATTWTSSTPATTSPAPYSLPNILSDNLVVHIYLTGADSTGTFTVTGPTSPWNQRAQIISAVGTDFNAGITIVDQLGSTGVPTATVSRASVWSISTISLVGTSLPSSVNANADVASASGAPPTASDTVSIYMPIGGV